MSIYNATFLTDQPFNQPSIGLNIASTIVSNHISSLVRNAEQIHKYSKKHTWVYVGKNIGTAGISDKYQDVVGEIVYADFPILESIVKKNDDAGHVTTAGGDIEVFSPVSGRVVVVNHGLEEISILINASSEEKGWIYKIRLPNLHCVDGLYSGEEYSRYWNTVHKMV